MSHKHKGVVCYNFKYWGVKYKSESPWVSEFRSMKLCLKYIEINKYLKHN